MGLLRLSPWIVAGASSDGRTLQDDSLNDGDDQNESGKNNAQTQACLPMFAVEHIRSKGKYLSCKNEREE